MPKEAEYTLAWSSDLQGYEVIHGPSSFSVDDTTSLHFWLDRADTFHFSSEDGYTCTLRKEVKQRGGGYWYAYKRVNGKVKKKYLGDTSKITLVTLEDTAQSFVKALPPLKPPPAPKPPPRKATLPPFAKSLESALRIYGFASIPTKRELITRYRDLSKQHHPDTGGLHEDMVTVNLAYGYLKHFVK